MKTLKYGDKLLIIDGREPLQFVDMATKKLYKYPAIYYDEASDWPVYKWWRNPIKWRQWRKILKISKRNTKIVLYTTPTGHNEFYEKSKP